MNLSKNPIAGFVACPKCQRPSLVHFPKGGPRRKSPYLSCPEHGNQQDISRDYFVENTVNTLPDFVEKHGDSEHCNELAEVLNKYEPVINNELLSLMRPVVESAPQEPEQLEEKEENMNKQPQSKRLFDEQGNVIDEQQAPQETETKAKSDGAAVVLIIVLVSAMVLTGGYVVIKKIQRNKQQGGGE